MYFTVPKISLITKVYESNIRFNSTTGKRNIGARTKVNVQESIIVSIIGQ